MSDHARICAICPNRFHKWLSQRLPLGLQARLELGKSKELVRRSIMVLLYGRA
ncbi:unnamed protein product [Acanthoscelides obtectus]|uniref:Uncharacterized protein n=1 Tax=Acanthoscelides obtectus TaxID=200917 RepID=A0A9P0PLG9_ACAOB|nr:unnamed protein product [Acanthoscelides obtectus]CAH1999404.1 unnamed protein product [Acanthoscelides obtectus]CAK1632940.1 hypothetical protein AOBTE_LOCUS7835 [Acanthoscelides obtectus]CAK1632995.1 hypothetical protein AOBTE_LOCUS7862 [Acanthoscelides obtectus]